MNILICGASGFIGRNLTMALSKHGHNVIRAVRKPQGQNDIAVDFRNDTDIKHWLPRLETIDAVINAVGTLRDNDINPMHAVHQQTPLALFAACKARQIRRVVHISALGVGSPVHAVYFTSRIAAEHALQAFPPHMHWLCLRPSVIYGEDGESARMFRRLASLQVHMLPMGGHQAMQPVHINDICFAVCKWIEDEGASSGIIDAVGGSPTTLRGMLDSYRHQLGYAPACHVTVPEWIVRTSANLGDFVSSSPLSRETLDMLVAGNVADAAAFTELLGSKPLSYRHFMSVSKKHECS